MMTDEMPDGHKADVCQLSILEKSESAWKIVVQTWQEYSEGKLIEVK